jgi:hypothetical protein
VILETEVALATSAASLRMNSSSVSIPLGPKAGATRPPAKLGDVAATLLSNASTEELRRS